MTKAREIIVCQDQEEIFRRAADLFVQLAEESIAAQGRFSVALSGGSTPKGMFALLATDAYRDKIDWQKVYLFWGDERSVPPSSDQSNYRMANEALITKVPVPGENVHRMVGEAGDINASAQSYEDLLKHHFQVEGNDFPRFDLIMLGMGDDGHTASLFPGTTALKEEKRVVVVNWVEKFNTNRITLTAPAINNARNILFMAAGAAKQQPLKEVLTGAPNSDLYPSQLIKPSDGRLIWMVDQAAVGNENYH